MLSQPEGPAAPSPTGVSSPGAVVSPSPFPKAAQPPVVLQRADPTEIQRLRRRLLDLILEDHHRREGQRQRGLSACGADSCGAH